MVKVEVEVVVVTKRVAVVVMKLEAKEEEVTLAVMAGVANVKVTLVELVTKVT